MSSACSFCSFYLSPLSLLSLLSPLSTLSHLSIRLSHVFLLHTVLLPDSRYRLRPLATKEERRCRPRRQRCQHRR
jgi:hypothetical protein